jgi:hypothetical protein
LATAKRRTARSFEVNAPSLKIGWLKRLVVIISTPTPVSPSASRRRVSSLSRVASSLPNGTTSSSWNVIAAAPSSPSRCTASTESSGGRLAGPKTSTACQPTVQRPKENLSAGVGV